MSFGYASRVASEGNAHDIATLISTNRRCLVPSSGRRILNRSPGFRPIGLASEAALHGGERIYDVVVRVHDFVECALAYFRAYCRLEG
jgi:hypothetical protein